MAATEVPTWFDRRCEMRSKLIFMIAVFGFTMFLIPAERALSQDMAVEGELQIGGVIYDTSGSKAKSHEYKDTRSGVSSEAKIMGDAPDFFIRGEAGDVGYDTQHYRVEGGHYSIGKGWVDYNEIVHNITTDARSFYNGVGSGTLTGAPGTTSDTWPSTFDYSTKRKKFGAGFDLKAANPFFFNADFSHEKKEGIRPIGNQATFSGTNYFVELPEPIDYRTYTVNLEAGYAKNPFFLSVGYLFSDFSNGYPDLNFTTDSTAGSGGTNISLPADSRMHRFAVTGNVQLPMKSRFSVNLSNARTTSETTSYATFDGRVDTSNYDFVLTSNPVNFIDGKAYYKYYDRDNKSTSGAIADLFDSSIPPGTVMTNPLNFTKRAFGGELGFRLPAKFRLGVGYKNAETHRKFSDEVDPAGINAAEVLPYNNDDIYTSNLKWSGLDFMSAEISYERLSRTTDYQTPESQNLIFRNFSYAAQDRDTFKIMVDLFPTDSLNLSFEYAYMKSTYNDTRFGVTGDRRNLFGINGDYAFRKLARFSVYFDAEKAILDQSATTSASTGTPQWDSMLEEITYGFGAKAEVYPLPKKLTLTFQGDFTKNRGSNNFAFYGTTAQYLSAFQLPAGGAGLPVDIPNVDCYERYSLRFMAAYNFSAAWTITLGYAYDRYLYSDDQLDNYRYIVNLPSGAVTGYLSGAYARPEYIVNTVFVNLTYRFNQLGGR
jgi:MtrB/PioB family decaheme-associated outer membrane protein